MMFLFFVTGAFCNGDVLETEMFWKRMFQNGGGTATYSRMFRVGDVLLSLGWRDVL
jgi:hypothetical protein